MNLVARELLGRTAMKRASSTFSLGLAALFSAGVLACGSTRDTTQTIGSGVPGPPGTTATADPSLPGDGATSGTVVRDGGSAATDAAVSGFDSGLPESACTAAGTTICAKACACSGDGSCTVTTTVGATPASLGFKGSLQCLDWYVRIACQNGGKAGIDYTACENDLATATCAAPAVGVGLALPESCH